MAINGGEDSDRSVLDLRLTDEGVSCKDYSLILTAGPSSKDMSQAMRDRLNKHYKACAYHRSNTFYQSALYTPVSPELEKTAIEVIKKYDSEEEDKKSGHIEPVRLIESPPID